MPPLPEVSSSIALSLIQKCTSITSLRKARQIHALILTLTHPTLPDSPFLNNNLLSMYVRCSSFTDSQHLFDKMPHRNIVSYNALISAYSRNTRYADLSFCLHSRLQNERSIRPNGATFTSLLQASSSLQDCLIGSSLHAQCSKIGFLNDVRVQTSLLGMYSDCGVLECAKDVFYSMVDKDDVAWNAIILGYIKNDEIGEGLELFGSMMREGVSPTQYTYSMVLNGCSKLGDSNAGELVHAQVIVSGTIVDLPMHNALLNMYCSRGDILTASRVFQIIEDPDLVSWNSMIAGLSQNGEGEKAITMFIKLRQLAFHHLDEFTYASVLSAAAAFPFLIAGKQLHAQIEKVGLQRNVYVGSMLISMYFCSSETESVQKIFDSILKKDNILWTHMISGYCKIGDSENAIKHYHGMLEKGHVIDSFVLSSVMSACADIAARKQGEIIHSHAVKTGYNFENTVCGSLIDMYAKAGDLQAAEYIFSGMPNPDLKCWNSMLGGYGHHGQAEKAFTVFYLILKFGMNPDQVTFLSMLAACSHCGMVNQGKFFWKYMEEIGIIPGPKHYSCMISLLSRAGLLEEAEELIMGSPFHDHDIELWRTLLSSCVSSGNFDLGIRAAEQVVSIDSEDTATNVLLANLYAKAGRWDCVIAMRRKMRGSTLDKDPGLSWIEVMNNIQVFSSGDQSHTRDDKMHDELTKMLGNLLISEADDIHQQLFVEVARPEKMIEIF